MEILSKAHSKPKKRMTERDAMELRLAVLDGEPDEAEPVPMADYEIARQRVAAAVAASRQRSHRITGDLATDSMLRDIGPGLWTSINPGYTTFGLSSTSHSHHAFDPRKGWADRVDKSHHLKQDAFMAHADKCAMRHPPCAADPARRARAARRAPPRAAPRPRGADSIGNTPRTRSSPLRARATRRPRRCLQLGEKPFVSGGMKLSKG